MMTLTLTRDELFAILTDEPSNWGTATVTVDGPYTTDEGFESRAIRTIAYHAATGLEVVTYCNLMNDGRNVWTEEEDYEPLLMNARQPDGSRYESYEMEQLIPMYLQAMGTTADTVLS